MTGTRAGIDLGGTHLRIGVFEDTQLVWEQRRELRLFERCRAEAPDEAAEILLSALLTVGEEARRAHPTLRALGLAVPGFVDPDTGFLASSPNIPGIVDLDLAGPLRERLGIDVRIANDANAAAWGEFCLGAHGATDSLLYIGLGTGVGGGLVERGRLYTGQHGLAMEIGHILIEAGGRLCGCGKRGCLEQYASANAVSLSYLELSGQSIDARRVAERAEAGEPDALASLSRAGEALGRAIAELVTILDVGTVVIGGGLSNAWELLRPACEWQIEQHLVPASRERLRIRVSRCADQCGILGAALLA